MTGLWQGWVGFWSRKEPGTSLALFRIAVALTVLYTLYGVVAADLVDVVWVDLAHGGYRTLPSPHWLIAILGGPTPTVVWSVLLVSAGAAMGMLLGVGGRFTVLVTLQTFMAVTDLNGHAGGSYDELIHNALWLLFLGPSTATLSVDCWRRTGRLVDATPVNAAVRYLAVYQLILMYWATGLQKVSTYWVPGGDFTALYYILQQPSWHRVDMEWLAPFAFLTQAATAVTWFWEVLSPLWLLAFWYALTPERPGRLRAWSNRLHVCTVYALIGAFFHISVTLVMNIGPFSLATLAFYTCLVHPDRWKEARRWRERLGRTPAVLSPR